MREGYGYPSTGSSSRVLGHSGNSFGPSFNNMHPVESTITIVWKEANQHEGDISALKLRGHIAFA
jgi:hypothetical protein